MKNRYFCKVFVYISLLASGLLMTKSAIDHYEEGNTAFKTYESTIALEDLPVLTICYENDGGEFDLFSKCKPRLNESFDVGWTFDGTCDSANYMR